MRKGAFYLLKLRNDEVQLSSFEARLLVFFLVEKEFEGVCMVEKEKKKKEQ